MSIIVENDGLYEDVGFRARTSLEEVKGEEIVPLVRDAGIVGMGGAGFPTHVKLSPKEPEKIDVVIANCAGCEPYLTSDYRRMLEEPEKLVGGLKLILKLFPNAHGVLAVEDNKPDCIALLQKVTRDETRISVKALKTKYPQGGERQLIYAVTGRRINSTMLPADVGCVVNNVDTMVAVYRAVMEGRPLMERIVTVTGDAVAQPANFRVRIGSCYEEVLAAAGGFKDITRIASSSPVMWQQVCLKNRENISQILGEFIQTLTDAKQAVDQGSEQTLYSIFESSRDYRNSMPEGSSGPIKKQFAVYCDIIDEAGGIATIATILASNMVNIKNIGIIHNREFEEGVLRIEFYDENASAKATELLKKHRYIVYEV